MGIPATTRILLIDVDGTLVTYENTIPASAARALRRARAAGHRLYACTGRSRAEMPPALWNLDLHGMIGGNGGYAEDDGEVILHSHLSAEQCRQAVGFLRERGLTFYLEANSGLYAPPDFTERALTALRAYRVGKGADAARLTVPDVFPDMILTEDLVRGDINKISFVLADPVADMEAARAAFPSLRAGTWGGRGHEALFGDLAPVTSTKVGAIETLLARLGASREQAVAFGDADVDIDMLRYCGTGVAMGNGSDGVKEAADLVTSDVEEDGLARALERLGLVGRA